MQFIKRNPTEICQRFIENRTVSLNASRIEMGNISNILFTTKINTKTKRLKRLNWTS